MDVGGCESGALIDSSKDQWEGGKQSPVLLMSNKKRQSESGNVCKSHVPLASGCRASSGGSEKLLQPLLGSSSRLSVRPVPVSPEFGTASSLRPPLSPGPSPLLFAFPPCD